MGDTINFDYYYGIEAEQFSFYRVPRLLIKDERFKGLSSDANKLRHVHSLLCNTGVLEACDCHL